MTSSPYKKAWYLLLIVIIAVTLALIFRFYQGEGENSPILLVIMHSILLTGGLWTGCVIIVEWLWVKFPWEKTPVTHLLLEISLILLYNNLFILGVYWLEIRSGLIPPVDDIFMGILTTNLITFLITAIHEAAAFYQQWKYNFSKSVKLEKDNLEARYEMLRSQINPHFLFNSLNGLVTLIDDNEKAVSYIQNLSDFLRYMLQNRDRQLILLREEISVLMKYIELQKLRFQDNLRIQIDVDEKFYHYSTPPLVLQMLVENCIKHNIISGENPLTITVRADKEWILVTNNLQRKENPSSPGHGLQNISDRYSFFTTQQVKIHETNSIFAVEVPLLLADL